MFGRMMNEALGKIHFWGTVIPFNFIFIPLFVLGLAGQHRRIYNYNHFPELAEPARPGHHGAGRHARLPAGVHLQLRRELVEG
jgi:heme/copper-type cytochrome/quinol oxidase subunit 1